MRSLLDYSKQELRDKSGQVLFYVFTSERYVCVCVTGHWYLVLPDFQRVSPLGNLMLNAYRLLTVATFGAYRLLAISFIGPVKPKITGQTI
jgi:hypothetical protein